MNDKQHESLRNDPFFIPEQKASVQTKLGYPDSRFLPCHERGVQLSLICYDSFVTLSFQSKSIGNIAVSQHQRASRLQ
jgi:hypothetical protein